MAALGHELRKRRRRRSRYFAVHAVKHYPRTHSGTKARAGRYKASWTDGLYA